MGEAEKFQYLCRSFRGTLMQEGDLPGGDTSNSGEREGKEKENYSARHTREW